MGIVVFFLRHSMQQKAMEKNHELMETFNKISTQLKKKMSLKVGFNAGMLHIIPFIRTKLLTVVFV